jgi:lipase ATG15
MLSGHVCIGLSVLFIVLVLAGLLVWAGQTPLVVFVVVMIVLLCCLSPILISSYQMYRFNRNVDQTLQEQEDDKKDGHHVDQAKQKSPSEQPNTSGAVPFDEEEDPTIVSKEAEAGKNVNPVKKVTFFHSGASQPQEDTEENQTDMALISVWESVRISEMKPWFCWLTAILEVSIFFVWPFISLFTTQNIPVAIVFMVVGIPSVMRHYFNVTNLLQTVGPIDDMDLTSSMLSPALCGLGGGTGMSSPMHYEEDRKLKNQALVAAIVKRVTRSKATGNWISLFFLLFFCVFAGFLMASTQESFDYKVKGVVFADGFYYEQQPGLPYPTCSVQKGFAFPGQDASALADYSFLATMAFAAPDESQPLLDQWFGENQVIDDYQYVQEYREATGTQSHPVSYKLFTIPALPQSAVVSIRGSEAMWDWMVDLQLWAGGVLAQLTEAINPFGWLWAPILDEMVYIINSVQTDQLKAVSYYQYTSAFIDELYAGFGGRQYQSLRVTGASLGGGLAILTGAITGASAISMSGLNAMYSRRTFDPPITQDQLNTRVFNVIPDRDIIARIDKPGMLVQRMQCRGPKNSFFACHSMWRSLCEVQYQCGSNGRPINCWCSSKYGYPVPTSNTTVSWDEACADA